MGKSQGDTTGHLPGGWKTIPNAAGTRAPEPLGLVDGQPAASHQDGHAAGPGLGCAQDTEARTSSNRRVQGCS